MDSLPVFIALFTCCLMSIGKAQILPPPYIRGNLSINIVVRYPQTQLTSNQQTTDLYIIGNGLGLDWNNPTRLTKSSSPDIWSIKLTFTGSQNGYTCSTCVYKSVLSYNDRFEFRIITSNRIDMIGANFGLPLHQSMSEPFFESRQHIVTPYFFTRTGSVSGTTVKSATDTIIGTRRWYYYLPPSFKENTYKTYPTLFGFDQNAVYLEAIKSMVEQATVDLGISDEVVIIGSEDYSVENVTENSGTNRGRLVLLTPSPAVEYFCTEGTFGDACNGCVPPEASMETLGAEGGDFRIFYEYLKNGCGYPMVIGGHGDKYLDYMTKEVLPAINSLANNRLKTDSENVGLFGCSLGGLMSCHGTYTRPETFGFGACQSASFWWPRQADLNLGFEFLNKTLKTMQGPRAPQKYYLDVSMDEVDPYYSQRETHIAVFNQLKENSKQFKTDETLFFSLIYDQPHAIGACNSRIWEFIGHFSPASGSPNKPI